MTSHPNRAKSTRYSVDVTHPIAPGPAVLREIVYRGATPAGIGGLYVSDNAIHALQLDGGVDLYRGRVTVIEMCCGRATVLPSDEQSRTCLRQRGQRADPAGVCHAYYRVVGVGGHSGPVRDDADDAIEAWQAAMRRRGYPEHQLDFSSGDAATVGRVRLAVGTTRRAAEAADVSDIGGTAGRGEWRWVD